MCDDAAIRYKFRNPYENTSKAKILRRDLYNNSVPLGALNALQPWLLSIAVCVIVVAPASGQDRFEPLDPYVRDAMGQWRVPGLAIAVVKDGELVLARAYGNRHLEFDSPVTTDSVFPIASCTKSFTSACIALLVDEGKLRWDDPVRDQWPGFRVADPYVTQHVTIRDILCHRTGLVRGDLLGMTGHFTHAEMLNQLQYLAQASPFRSKVTYHNLMFTALGEIVEKKSGANWHDFVDDRIFEPLGMTSTTTNRALVDPQRLVTRHRMYDGEIGPLRTPNTDQMAPAGAIHSTVNDMAKWLSLHLRQGEHHGRQLIAKDSVREMHCLHQSIPVKWSAESDVYDARFVGTGLGWYVRDYRGRKVVQHGGAWGAETALVPEENLAVVVLSNRDWNSLVWMLVYDVIDAYVVGPGEAWSNREKWKFWLERGGPDAMDRNRKSQFAELQKARKTGTSTSLPVSHFAGTYRSTLYGDLVLTEQDGQLRVRFGVYEATLDHWENDSFYGHAVIEPFLDWLLKFDIHDGVVKGFEFMNVGWKDPDERFLFRRVVE